MSKHEFSAIRVPIERDNPSIVRDDDKCIKCGMCRAVCREEIAVNKLFDLEKTADFAICTHCGQCAAVCPVSAITEVYEYQKVQEAIDDPDKIVIFSTSPSVRVALGEEFGMRPGDDAEGKMVSALRVLGADFVLDTTFAADLTIVEEASELIERITKKTKPLPQFTSCCPAWVEFVETFYPEFIPHLSTAKSPIGMQGPTIKTYFAEKRGIDPRRIVNVAVTPCTAKKFEIRRPEMNASAEAAGVKELRDMDYVVTTRELARWIRERAIDFSALDDAEYDSLLGRGSGAGMIFGNTGGVMEAAVRTAYAYLTHEAPPEDFYQFKPVRGMDGLKEASLAIGSAAVKLAILHGSANANKLLKKMKRGDLHYDFVEVMTCRGGCVGGGGQPKTETPMTDEIRRARIAGLYGKDEKCPIRLSHENPDIKTVYREFYERPLGEKAESMLHTTYESKAHMLGK